MEEFHVTLNLNTYFNFDMVYFHRRYKLYYLSLISKATGEIIEIPLTDEQFDVLLKEMEENVKFLEDEYKFIKEEKWWFL